MEGAHMTWEGLWGIGNERKEIESGADARFCRTKGVEFYSKCNGKTVPVGQSSFSFCVLKQSLWFSWKHGDQSRSGCRDLGESRWGLHQGCGVRAWGEMMIYGVYNKFQ